MRNAAAQFDDDFASEKPARKRAARRPASAGKKKGKRSLPFCVHPRKAVRYGAMTLCGAAVIGIVVNALVLQKGRHPAPLFGKSISFAEAPSPRPAPAKKAALDPPPTAPAPVPRPAPVTVAEPRDDAQPLGDAIGRLIQGAPPPSEHADPKTVAGAQRALMKLGYVVKATGSFGPQTKKALEAFEKTRHLPVTGELNRRIVKILAAESGLKIEH